MSDTLKSKTTSALIWSAIDKAGFQLVALLVGIFTARILSPKDFGLMGALAVFTLLSNILVESGFTSALVRRKENTSSEYAAVLYFNLALSVVIYLTLFFSAPFIANFFNMPELCSLARFLFITIIINSAGIVQNIILTKDLAFNVISFADLVSAIVAGVGTIFLAVYGYDYWALAWQIVLQSVVRVVALWASSKWKPTYHPDFRIIREIFSFSFFLLVTNLINNVVKNIYNILIGRFFNVLQLGYYAQANKFQQIPSNVVSMTMGTVGLPVLSKLNSEPQRQLLYLRKIIRITAFLIFPVIVGMLSVTDGLVEIVLTAKWLPAVPYFQIMALAAIVFPLHTINLNILIAKGYSKDSFVLEMIKNTLIILSIFVCRDSIELMLVGFSAASLLSYACDLFWTRQRVHYKATHQLCDILPYAVISAVMFGLAKLIGYLSPFGLYLTTTAQVLASAVFYFVVLKLLGSQVINDAISLLSSHKST